MSEFWTKHCEKCGRIFEVGLWTRQTHLCNICEIEDDLDPPPDGFEEHMKGIREKMRDVPTTPIPDDELERNKEYTSEDFKKMIGDPYWGRKKKDRE